MATRHVMRFADRTDAGRQLAEALRAYRGQHPLVLAIPRGGVPIGRLVADALGGELDVVLVRKLGAPYNPEFAIGAVDENGHVALGPYAEAAGADEAYVSDEAAAQLALIRARRETYRPRHAAADPAGRLVIVVDDGLATGATMHAALAAVRAKHPARLVCAVPVASPRSLSEMRHAADEVVCLAAPADFQAVGQFYDRFPAVDDDEVIRLLDGASPPVVRIDTRHVRIPVDGVSLDGDLAVPVSARGLVIFSHGSGSSRLSPRNRAVAAVLHRAAMATLLFDLLSPAEDQDPRARFDLSLLAARLDQALAWARGVPQLRELPVGLFGASTGAAAALMVAARRPHAVEALVSRGGRPDLAGADALARVRAPTLLVVGAADTEVIALNRQALGHLRGVAELVLVPHATHLFEEPDTLEQAAALASAWFTRWLGR